MQKNSKRILAASAAAALLLAFGVCVRKVNGLSAQLKQEQALNNQIASELQKSRDEGRQLEDRMSSLDSELDTLKKENRELQEKYDKVVRQKASSEESKKIAYLTFDDGPSIYTEQLLKTLRDNGVHATFFVVGTNAARYPDVIRTAQKDGNAVGIHCYNHTYSALYASQAAFFDDYSRMQKLLADLLGAYPNICRFPGGTANTVSDRYGGAHFMQKILPQVTDMGIVPFDWNVDAGDAEGPPASAARIVSNIVGQAKKQRRPVILCHDIKKSTVEAMPAVIRQLKNLGYSFDVLSAEAPVCLQKPL